MELKRKKEAGIYCERSVGSVLSCRKGVKGARGERFDVHGLSLAAALTIAPGWFMAQIMLRLDFFFFLKKILILRGFSAAEMMHLGHTGHRLSLWEEGRAPQPQRRPRLFL